MTESARRSREAVEAAETEARGTSAGPTPKQRANFEARGRWSLSGALSGAAVGIAAKLAGADYPWVYIGFAIAVGSQAGLLALWIRDKR